MYKLNHLTSRLNCHNSKTKQIVECACLNSYTDALDVLTEVAWHSLKKSKTNCGLHMFKFINRSPHPTLTFQQKTPRQTVTIAKKKIVDTFFWIYKPALDVWTQDALTPTTLSPFNESQSARQGAPPWWCPRFIPLAMTSGAAQQWCAAAVWCGMRCEMELSIRQTRRDAGRNWKAVAACRPQLVFIEFNVPFVTTEKRENLHEIA